MNNWTKTLNKDRASGVLIKDGKILVIHRIREDREYYVIPGGSVEENETIEEALDREMVEELTIKIQQKEFMFKIEDGGRFEHYFLIKEYKGSPKLGGPELERMNQNNQYLLEMIDIDRLSEINLYPSGFIEKLKKILIK